MKKMGKRSVKTMQKVSEMKRKVEIGDDVEDVYDESMDDEEETSTRSGPELSHLDDIDMDSDEELREAFASGLLKPGLNTMGEVRERQVINDVEGLQSKLEEFQQSNLPWIERLECISKPLQIDEESEDAESSSNNNNVINDDDELHNDHKREMIFYRQAQATVMDSLPRLQSMKVKTKRPEDYFAQMLKSDDHMLKIREKLVSKQVTEERRQKVRRLRELKKFGKKVQIEVQQKRQQEKKEMMDQLKRFRKGQTNNIDFLDDPNDIDGSQRKGKKQQVKFQKPQRTERQRWKDGKFGYGGKKRGMKTNNQSSLNAVDREPVFRKGGPKKGPGGKKASGMKAKRPGKATRQNIKNRR